MAWYNLEGVGFFIAGVFGMDHHWDHGNAVEYFDGMRICHDTQIYLKSMS